MNAYQILDIARNRELEDLGQMTSDYGEQIKVGYQAPTGMEGGFGQNEQMRLRTEADKARKDILENYRIKRAIIQERERQAKEARERQKKQMLMKLGGTALGALLAAPTGGLSLGAGAGLGGSLGGSLGSAMYGDGSGINIDWSALDELWRAYKK